MCVGASDSCRLWCEPPCQNQSGENAWTLPYGSSIWFCHHQPLLCEALTMYSFRTDFSRQSKPRDILLARGLSTSLGRSVEIRTALRFDWAQRLVSQPESARPFLSFWLRLYWEPVPRALCVLPFAAGLRSR